MSDKRRYGLCKSYINAIDKEYLQNETLFKLYEDINKKSKKRINWNRNNCADKNEAKFGMTDFFNCKILIDNKQSIPKITKNGNIKT